MARPLAYKLGLQYTPQALRKTRDTPSQVGLNYMQRKENVRNAFQANPEIVQGRSILLMDDVATTGSTILACTEALLSADAREVYALTIARAPSHLTPTRV
ncbi:MAG TPA: phosphoribosyltransferase family protein [Anaerolineales bacterium]|nr:phosphoribosyltransferase family protein [Anaerolineales bacterium]